MRYIILFLALNLFVLLTKAQGPPPAGEPIPKRQDLGQPKPEIFEFAQEVPKAKINLQEFFAENVKYPDLALEAAIQGTVYVRAVVKTNGSIDKSTVTIAKGLKGGGAGLNEEAMRIIKLLPEGAFEPAKNNDVPVDCWIAIPIRFQIDGGTEEEAKEVVRVAAVPTVNLDDFFAKNLDYKKVRKSSASLKLPVYVRAIINEKGEIDEKSIHVVYANSKALKKEAVRLVKMLPSYKPATINGTAISEWVEIPVKFSEYVNEKK